ncbi:hypothetical protein [Lignipirellula cremea]|uniref:Zinc finger/thioredoxin putative domain-containing protein n=1 Tax=Lignipirellula cremea TaxID=2528010 RepID=A0A518DZE7_9BACT|nr:hypothetical protein [Lignipirellula cremea]QDU97220.1 hypothetical protein Pla8534_50650 [Lignipirellula cremea]
MPLVASCTKCQQRFQLKDEMAGKRFKCPKCSSPVQAPAAGGAAQPPAAKAPPAKAPPAKAPPAKAPLAKGPAAKAPPAKAPAARAPSAPAPKPAYSSFLDEELGELQAQEDLAEQERRIREFSNEGQSLPEEKAKLCEMCKKEMLRVTSVCPYCGHLEGDVSKM